MKNYNEHNETAKVTNMRIHVREFGSHNTSKLEVCGNASDCFHSIPFLWNHSHSLSHSFPVQHQ